MNADVIGVHPRSSAAKISTDIRIVLDPEAPGFVDPLFSVVDSDSWSSGDLARRDVLVLLDPNSVTQKICAVELPVDSHRNAQFPWTVRQVVIRM
jgi:hypothetical protein